MHKIMNFIARYLGRDGYELDESFKLLDLVELSIGRAIQLIMFLISRVWLKKSGLLNFMSFGVKISYARHLSIGSGVFFGRGVTINALCRAGVIIGSNVTIKSGTCIDCTGVYSDLGEGLKIGDRVGISENTFIQVRGAVCIEDDVIIGPGVKIFSENHIFDDPTRPIRTQGTTRVGVHVGKGAWIGTSAIILDGVSIGEFSVIAAGSVVTKDVPARCVAAGVPARKIRDL